MRQPMMLIILKVGLVMSLLACGESNELQGKQLEDLNCALDIDKFLKLNQKLKDIPDQLIGYINQLNFDWVANSYRDLQPKLRGEHPSTELCLPVWRLYYLIEEEFFNCAYRLNQLTREMEDQVKRFSLMHKARVVCMPGHEHDAEYRAKINAACLEAVPSFAKTYKFPKQLSNFVDSIEAEFASMPTPPDNSVQRELIFSKPRPSVEDCKQIEKLKQQMDFHSSCVTEKRSLDELLYADDGVNKELEMLTKSQFICDFLNILAAENDKKVLVLDA